MGELSKLKAVLAASLAKHGNQPLTVQHLYNIINSLEKAETAESFNRLDEDKRIFNDVHNDANGT
jgi:hypothetical protein